MCNARPAYGSPLILVVVAWTLILGHPGYSQGVMREPGSEPSLSYMVKEAGFIFSGTVEKLEFRESRESPDAPNVVPSTYVTYRIEYLLKGRSAEGTHLTLRFLGGQASDGRYLEVSHIPQFQVGSRDLLFVHQNTAIDCPIVDCPSGRFRIIEDLVYGNDGLPVVSIRKGHILYDTLGTGASKALRHEYVVEEINKEVRRLYTPKEQEGWPPVQSFQPGQENPSPLQEDQSPPAAIPPMSGKNQTQTEADRVEEEAIKQNQGNPVLREIPLP